MNIKDIQKTMQEFMKQQEKQELMNGRPLIRFNIITVVLEQISDIMADDDDVSIANEAEVDKIIDEVVKGNKQEAVREFSIYYTQEYFRL